MARQQRFDWFLATQRSRKSKSLRSRRALRSRKPRFEPLEVRNLLSVSAGMMFATCEPSAPVSLEPASLESPHVLWATQEAFELSRLNEGPAEFDARDPWDDLDPGAEGIQITYSYSNFLDGGLAGGLTPEELMAATEEALAIWATHAPLEFIEVSDTGPEASDDSYSAGNHPILRIGHHNIDGPGGGVLAHAYFPSSNGLGGDVHFDTGDGWSIHPEDGFDVIEVMVHELGHALGLGHEMTLDAIMNPFYGGRYDGLDTGFLLEDDIAGIQALYGEGDGGVTPIGPLVVNSTLDVDDIFEEINPDTGNVSHIDQTPDELTLREAVHFSSISVGRRSISFDESIYGGTIQIQPSLGSFVIDTPMVIEGAGSNITVKYDADASEKSRIFVIDNDDGDDETPDTIADVFISGLTLSGGASDGAGGAIFTSENLTLEDMNIFGNSSEETGGGIFASGPLSLLRTTIEENRADDDGGGLHATAGARIDSSAFINNHSDGKGGAIAGEGEGAKLIVTTSTLSGNTANSSGGGIHISDGNPTLFHVLHSTIYQNHADFDNNGSGSGGGIYMFDGVLALEHSIVAGNTDNGIAPDIDNVNLFASPTVLARYSLISNANGSQITQLDPNLLNIDPLLSPLADNGGPTRSHLPLDVSLALNSGNPSILFPTDFDQRGIGFRRIHEGVIDIGAVESGGFTQSFTVNTLVDKDDITDIGIDTSPEDTSLREAVHLANLQLGPNLINFTPAMNGGTINLAANLGEILISDELTFDASDLSGGLTINGETLDPTPEQNNGDGARLFRVDDGIALNYFNTTFIGLTLTGGDVSGNGGAIHAVDNLTLQFVSIVGNYATGDGGGVYHKPVEPTELNQVGSKLLIENSTIANNTAGGNGGGLYSDNQKVSFEEDPDPTPLVGQIINTTISNNVAGSEGGGIYNYDGHLELRHVTVTENQAANGSGVVSYGDARTKTSVYSTIIAGNVINSNATGFDIQSALDGPGNSFESLGYNLIGFGNTAMVFDNNDQTEVTDPKLLPLGNYGGKTMTHALEDDSPAIDASDPDAFLPGGMTDSEEPIEVTDYDQRGESYSRIGDGDADENPILDVGAFEKQTPEPTGDFDNDGDIDGADFLAWQRGYGKTDAERSDGDSDFDRDVDADDLSTWSGQFGKIGPASVITPQRSASSENTESAESGSMAAASLLLHDPSAENDPVVEQERSPEFQSDRAAALYATASAVDAFMSGGTIRGSQQESPSDPELFEPLDLVFESLGLGDLF